jgi:hypothetical protein
MFTLERLTVYVNYINKVRKVVRSLIHFWIENFDSVKRVVYVYLEFLIYFQHCLLTLFNKKYSLKMDKFSKS